MLTLVEYGFGASRFGVVVVGFDDGCHCLDDDLVSVSLTYLCLEDRQRRFVGHLVLVALAFEYLVEHFCGDFSSNTSAVCVVLSTA